MRCIIKLEVAVATMPDAAMLPIPTIWTATLQGSPGELAPTIHFKVLGSAAYQMRVM
jgi:hypothetical protein